MAIFTARHYKALAAVIAAADCHDDGELIGPALAADIVKLLAADNPHFDREKFEAAAGLDTEEQDPDTKEAQELRHYTEYCAAKFEINELPLSLGDWREFNMLASKR